MPALARQSDDAKKRIAALDQTVAQLSRDLNAARDSAKLAEDSYKYVRPPALMLHQHSVHTLKAMLTNTTNMCQSAPLAPSMANATITFQSARSVPSE